MLHWGVSWQEAPLCGDPLCVVKHSLFHPVQSCQILYLVALDWITGDLWSFGLFDAYVTGLALMVHVTLRHPVAVAWVTSADFSFPRARPVEESLSNFHLLPKMCSFVLFACLQAFLAMALKESPFAEFTFFSTYSCRYSTIWALSLPVESLHVMCNRFALCLWAVLKLTDCIPELLSPLL